LTKTIFMPINFSKTWQRISRRHSKYLRQRCYLFTTLPFN
jgi:hypothetical protein